MGNKPPPPPPPPKKNKKIHKRNPLISGVNVGRCHQWEKLFKMKEWYLMKHPPAPGLWWGRGMPSGTQHGWAWLPLRGATGAAGCVPWVCAWQESFSLHQAPAEVLQWL